MYLGISSESAFRTAVSALALKPELDAWLNQKKVQIQLENQASLFKLTQADLTNTISPAFVQITEAVNEVKQMVQSVSSITIGKAKASNPLSEGEEDDEPPRKKQKKRNYRKKNYESDISEEEDQSPKRKKDNQRSAWLLK